MSDTPVFTDAIVVGHNVPQADYRLQKHARGEAGFVMCRSELMEFNHCPSRWRAGVENPDTKPTEWGTLLDCLLLEPATFEGRFIVAPAQYHTPGMECPRCHSITDDSKTCRKCKVERVAVVQSKDWNKLAEECAKWETEQKAAGKTIVSAENRQRAKFAAAQFFKDPEIKDFVAASARAVMVLAVYNDPETGLRIPVKILLDLVPRLSTLYGKMLGDFKTAATAHRRTWPRAVFNHDYAVQAALYMDIYTAATGEDRTDFAHVIQESCHPYWTAKRILTAEFLGLGRMLYRNALARYARAIATGVWEGFDDDAREHWNGWAFCAPEPWMLTAF